MAIDRMYIIIALLYAVVGMVLGIFMAATQNHAQHVTHAHILLVGFIVSFAYAAILRLWVLRADGTLAWSQFGLHQFGALAMVISLGMLYGNVAPLEKLEPVLALSSIAVLLGTVLMLVMVVRSARG